MLAQNFRRLSADLKHDRKILRDSAHIPRVYCYTTVAWMHTGRLISTSLSKTLDTNNANSPAIASQVFENRKNTVTQYRYTATHLSAYGKSTHYGSNLLFTKRNPFNHNHSAVNGVRHYTDFNDLRIVPPEFFNNAFVKAISKSSAIEFTMDQLVWLHSYTGLPWWSTIAVLSLLLRVAVSPLTVLQHRNNAKLENLKYDMEDISTQLKLDIAKDIRTANFEAKQVTHLYQQNVDEGRME